MASKVVEVHPAEKGRGGAALPDGGKAVNVYTTARVLGRRALTACKRCLLIGAQL